MRGYILGAILVMSLFALPSFAQDTTGKIVGTVSAADGAIPGATIVVTDNQTKKERTVTATDAGTFEASQLEFGTYTVRITATGYKTFVANEVKIDAGREYPLNAQLEVGEVTETVTVTAGQESINSTNAELSTTVSTQQIRELPLNTRNALGLLNLQAGVNATTNSINGQRSSGLAVTRDGLNVQDNYIRTGAFVSDQPTVDDVSEFTITTQNAGADQGGGSSLVQLVTPRGGKDFHGSLYEFNRNSEFAANSFFSNTNGVKRPFLNRNQYGGSFSGALPFFNFGEGGKAFSRDRTFFFFNYEAFRLAQQATITGLTTLLAPARNGDFTYVGNDGVTRTVNVLNGNGFNLTGTNAAVFASAGGVLSVDPVIQNRLLANLPTTGNGVLTGINYLQQVTLLRGDPRTRNNYTTRIDHDVNDTSSVNVVYRFNDDTDARTDQAAGFSPNAFVSTVGPTYFLTGAYRSTFGNNFSNEFRAGGQKSGVTFQESNIPSNFLIAGTPFTSPEGSFRQQGRNTFYRNVQDNAVYSIGNHSLRFGGQFDYYKFRSFVFNGITQTNTITTTANVNTPGLTAPLLPSINTTDLARANALRFTLAGIISTGSRTANLSSPETGYSFDPSAFDLQYKVYSGYISDQWRFRPNLTFNLGLRYDYYTPLSNPQRRYLELQFPDPNNIASIARDGAQLNYIGTNTGTRGDFTFGDKNNFGPNFSFAYSPKFENGLFSKLLNNQTVIRGGFRINYLNDEYLRAPDAFNQANAGLGSQVVQATNLRAALTPRGDFSSVPAIVTPPGFVAPPRTLRTNLLNAGFSGASAFGVDPYYQVPKVYEYNVGIQREIFAKNVLEVRYVGAYSNGMIRSIDQNEVEIEKNGFLADFIRARNNCTIQGRTLNPTAFDPALSCTNAANIGLPGQQNLTVFPNLGSGGLLTNATILSQIQNGTPGDLALTYIVNRLQGTVQFQNTNDITSIEVLTNGGKFRYNALQAEIRRRFSGGLYYQVNYTFQKTLSDVPDDSQLRQSPYQDNDNKGLQFGRPDYDRTHTINANAIYELPIGKGKRFLNEGGVLNAIFGGLQLSTIVNYSSGPPLGVVDPRGTNARAGRSGRQSAISTLSTKEIKDLTGIFKTPNGIYFINPKVLFAEATAPGQPTLRGFDLNQALPAGYTLSSVRAASPYGTAPFAGQVFFFNQPGQTGNLPRNFINGPYYFNIDVAATKNIRFSESMRLQLRAEAFNITNKQVPFYGADLNVNSSTFGRITSTYNAARVLQFGARFDF